MINSSIQELPREEVMRYLQELGIDLSKAASVTLEEIKTAYRKRAKETHPDTGGNDRDFHAVSHAYKMLTDSEYRHRNVSKKQPFGLNVDLKIGCTFEDAFFGRPLNVTIHQIKATDEGMIDLEEVQKNGKTEVHTHTITINLPPGSVNGYQTVRHGLGIQVGNQKGDLKIQVIPNPKPGVMVRGSDVISQVPIPLSVMLKGGKVDVMTMYGLKPLWVPPGTMPGATLIIKKCGVSKVGNHVAVVQPIFPTQDELKKKDWTPLGINWKDHEAEIEKEKEEEEKMFKRFYTINLPFDTTTKKGEE